MLFRSVFITSKYTRSTKSDDAMYAWLENISSKEFELCIREFLPFGGKHQDTAVVSWKFKVRQRENCLPSYI